MSTGSAGRRCRHAGGHGPGFRFTDEKDARRRRLLALFGRVAGRGDHYPARLADFGSAEQARAELLWELAVDLAKAGVTPAWSWKAGKAATTGTGRRCGARWARNRR